MYTLCTLFVIICLHIIVKDVRSQCRDGWIKFLQSCYLIEDMKEEWGEAQGSCHALHSHLVEIESNIENMFVKAKLNERWGNTPAAIWTGGNDIETEGVFRWASTGKQFSYTDWYPGQPTKGITEDCMAFEYRNRNLHWHDYNCTTRLYYVCEMEIDFGSSSLFG